MLELQFMKKRESRPILCLCVGIVLLVLASSNLYFERERKMETSLSTEIPRIVHYPPSTLPSQIQHCKRIHKDWQHIHWTKEELQELLFFDYHQLNGLSAQLDLMLLVLHQQGGFLYTKPCLYSFEHYRQHHGLLMHLEHPNLGNLQKVEISSDSNFTVFASHPQHNFLVFFRENAWQSLLKFKRTRRSSDYSIFIFRDF
jgi:hypothetical protein